MKQYLTLPCRIFSQFLIRQVTRVFGLTLSSPRQPGHAFFSRVYAIQIRQFIPQGAISVVRIAFVFADLIGVMFVSCKGSHRGPVFGTDALVLGAIASDSPELQNSLFDNHGRGPPPGNRGW
jgi:hypothetical protein